METVEDRVDSIEEIMKQLSLAQLNTEKELTRLGKRLEESYQHTRQVLEESHQRTETELQSLSQEMKEFKDEMKAFKDEMKAFKDEMKAFKDEMKAFKDEMKAFKDEMKVFKDEMRIDRKKINIQWGNLANKMGTVVEDIVAPNIKMICQKHFNSDPNYVMIGVIRKSTDKLKEAQFDVIAVCDDFVLLNETKTSANLQYIDNFDRFTKSGEFYEFYPEYKDMKLIPVFSAIHISQDLIDELTKRGIYSMVPSGNTMDIINFDKIKQK